jgi:tRNA(Ile)-lysidine synthase TilS/MesJ
MREYQECSNCILDTNDDAAINFDEKGVCNYCNTYYKNYGNIENNPDFNGSNLNPTLNKIKSLSKGKKFDSIMGLSGGVDSSYLALKAKEWGLNPLLVHFDNGWNSELAVQNINAIIDYTGFELYTYVVDWEEFRDLQLSYLKAGVLDWEIPTDHGFFACLFNQAYKRGIKTILTGHNYQTESILPKPMRWSKMDVANLKDIHGTFGKGKKINY